MTQQLALKDDMVSQSPEVASTLSDQLGVQPQNIVSFPDGLPGFEACRQFAVFSSDESAPLQCLHALDGPKASFIVMDPSDALPNYRCELSAADRSRLGVEQDNELIWLAIVTVSADGSITANLRAPVVINPVRMIGFQVMPYQCVYPLRHVIAGPR
jgi:flagellar assembly factor FliW